MRRTGLPSFLLAVSVALIPSAGVEACDSWTVRGAAFHEPRDLHRLAVIGDPGDARADEIEKSLSDWLAGEGAELNLEVYRLDPNDSSIDWQDFGIPSAPPSWPVTVLSGTSRTDRGAFYVHHWEPGPTPKELNALADSPLRQKLRDLLGRNITVLVHVPGTDGIDANVAATLADFERTTLIGPLGVTTIQLDRADPDEGIFLAFAGIPPTGPDWVGPVFGPGKMTAPMVGLAVSAARLDEVVREVAGTCSCLRPASTYGVDIPMKWDPALSDAAIPLPDPTAPEEPEPTSFSPEILGPTLWTIGGLAGLVFVAAAFIVFRRNAAVV